MDTKPTIKSDLTVIGAGPGGLSSAIYTASEGIGTIVLEKSLQTGGQAFNAARVENYLGFPLGLSGADLAEFATEQASRLGAKIRLNSAALNVWRDNERELWNVETDHEVIESTTVVAALGLIPRRLPVPEEETFRGKGLYYTPILPEERHATAMVIGGANSALQWALALCEAFDMVYVVIRGDDMTEASEYLTRRISMHAQVRLLTRTNVVGLQGDDSGIWEVAVEQSGKRRVIETRHVYVAIGAVARTEMLKGVETSRGFVKTDSRLSAAVGLWALGDVREGSSRRLGGAVGEGAMVAAQVHKFLADTRRA